MKIRVWQNYLYNSLVNGDGVRMVIFFSGCKRCCPGCHNKDLQSFEAGIEKDINEIVKDVLENKSMIDGVTLSGGDPIYQEKGAIELSKKLKEQNINICLYTGELFENINRELLENIDSVVDGEFKEDQLDTTFNNRGSLNQRIFIKTNGKWEEK